MSEALMQILNAHICSPGTKVFKISNKGVSNSVHITKPNQSVRLRNLEPPSFELVRSMVGHNLQILHELNAILVLVVWTILPG
ncbi:hypothetical protein HanXRQr2_Chr16g0759491 [Helianthus annuus]|uniref:Uncharacterized protein n=1 Tax=Helianthus annuus TaxID=4232 RepID=A0A9K3DSN2_HELAN|nr:hypothetical protein HanXRQr2_Chr16g0759491 [Helianthus annuus]KAJ0822078.1 hypothetical protein HanPSC8_Chr16g0727771 [Helianthus annuus]